MLVMLVSLIVVSAGAASVALAATRVMRSIELVRVAADRCAVQLREASSTLTRETRRLRSTLDGDARSSP
jgi:hypothetical protein